jgi:hypothetical protein
MNRLAWAVLVLAGAILFGLGTLGSATLAGRQGYSAAPGAAMYLGAGLGLLGLCGFAIARGESPRWRDRDGSDRPGG